ncbi:hypothetical protein MG293_011655 [Ovis ammon polii]|uniref:Uncharacterized protein n=1 Tax=Ovis ammon polii TaxID=230172 RepID=A0AAD4U4Q6_OVIAM|nr:hypothetical protein MG293_011655 [Ovis ammon polii]KAI4562452.1 hypothetical protein MJT46_011414 [Ovis ammon polii x Ovis aries]
MFVRCAPSSRYTLLFSHGNTVDLGQMCNFDIGLGSCISYNISYDLLRLRRELRQALPRRTSMPTSTPRGRCCAPGKICIIEMHKT